MRMYFIRNLLVEFDHLTDLLHQWLDHDQLPEIHSYSQKEAVKQKLEKVKTEPLSLGSLRELKDQLKGLYHRQTLSQNYQRNAQAYVQEVFQSQMQQQFIERFSKTDMAKAFATTLIKTQESGLIAKNHKYKYWQLLQDLCQKCLDAQGYQQRLIATQCVMLLRFYESSFQALDAKQRAQLKLKKITACFDPGLEKVATSNLTIECTLLVCNARRKDMQPIIDRFKQLQVSVWQHMRDSILNQFMHVAVDQYSQAISNHSPSCLQSRLAKILWYRLSVYQKFLPLPFSYQRVEQLLLNRYGWLIRINKFALSESDVQLHEDIVEKIKQKRQYLSHRQQQFCFDQSGEFSNLSATDLAVAGEILRKQVAICDRLQWWRIANTSHRQHAQGVMVSASRHH
jgi:hypothetical protein